MKKPIKLILCLVFVIYASNLFAQLRFNGTRTFDGTVSFTGATTFHGTSTFLDLMTLRGADKDFVIETTNDNADYGIRWANNGGTDIGEITQNEGTGLFKISGLSGGAGTLMSWAYSDAGVTTFGDIAPNTANADTIGSSAKPYANIISTLINGADFAMINRWRMLESEKYLGYPTGFALGNTHFKDGVVTGKMPIGARPIFVVTEDFIEYQGSRITPKAFKKLSGSEIKELPFYKKAFKYIAYAAPGAILALILK